MTKATFYQPVMTETFREIDFDSLEATQQACNDRVAELANQGVSCQVQSLMRVVDGKRVYVLEPEQQLEVEPERKVRRESRRSDRRESRQPRQDRRTPPPDIQEVETEPAARVVRKRIAIAR